MKINLNLGLIATLLCPLTVYAGAAEPSIADKIKGNHSIQPP